jgi:hypothetical protein
MSQSKKTERLAREYLENLQVRRRPETDHHILQDPTAAMEEARGAGAAPARAGVRRMIMTHTTRRVAAFVALTLLLAGASGLGGGSAAFSQARHVVSSTLARLQEAILRIRTGAPAVEAPLPPAPSADTDEQAPDFDVRAVLCAARFFAIPAGDEAVGQALQDQGIELIKASASPETCYATLRREQVEGLENALTVSPITSPRVVVGEGREAMIVTNVFGLAWLPIVASDGTRIESTFSFHDGQTGFEVPSVSAEEGGAILVHVKGIMPTGEDVLILLQVGYAPGA